MTEMAGGYSGTPLARKLGVRPGHHVLLMHRPVGWRIPDLPPDVTLAGRGAAPTDGPDITVVFCRSRRQLETDLPGLLSGIRPAASLWIAWPRRAAGHTSDVTENGLRELLLPTGLVDVKVAALGADWSGLKFVWRKSARP